MKFYAKNKKRFTYEYTNYVFDYIENNNLLVNTTKIYLLNRISKIFSMFVHGLITDNEYMNIIGTIYTLAYNESKKDITEQIPINNDISMYRDNVITELMK